MPRSSHTKPRTPSHHAECVALATWLDRAGVLYTAVPLGGLRDRLAGALVRAEGAKRGFPDFLIVTVPDGLDVRAVALEMKRRIRSDRSSPEQLAWIQALRRAGWEARVCHGADEAVAWLRSLGYSGL